jgi:hypothetical protein
VAFTIPIGVLLCAYKLGFGLVQNFLENFKTSSVWAHRTLHCAMSGAPAAHAQIPFCAALFGGHRTTTVRCLVCTGHAL